MKNPQIESDQTSEIFQSPQIGDGSTVSKMTGREKKSRYCNKIAHRGSPGKKFRPKEKKI
jgi:hypothetical protein